MAAAASAEPSSRATSRTAAKAGDFCTTACRPRVAAALSNTTGFAVALAATAIVARRRESQA